MLFVQPFEKRFYFYLFCGLKPAFEFVCKTNFLLNNIIYIIRTHFLSYAYVIQGDQYLALQLQITVFGK